MMDQDEWNINAFPELKNDLLKKLNIQQNTAQQDIAQQSPDDN
jgi:hypothetical protein